MGDRLPGMGDRLPGSKFLEGIAWCETECAAAAIKELHTWSAEGRMFFEALGMALAYLECAGSCHWGCAGGDHHLEYLIAGATSSAFAGLSWAKNGYYDQALSSARTLGETANLLALFDADRAKIAEWKSADEETRKRIFSAVKVRLAIEALNAPLPIMKERYRKLSTFSIHASPHSKSQAHHNPSGIGFTSPVFQNAGFQMGLNEIALPAAFIVLYAGKLLDMKDEIREHYRNIALALGHLLGSINVTEQGKSWFHDSTGAFWALRATSPAPKGN
jgi:hypothetical protein